MRVELGQHVRSQEGQDIGAIKHLIVDPSSGQVKTLVVEKGWLLPDDIELPRQSLQESEGKDLSVIYTAEQVQALPRFDESQYTPLPPEQTRLFPGYPLGSLLWPGVAMPPLAPGTPEPAPVVDGEIALSPPPTVAEHLRRQDETNVVISEGDDVFSQDGERIGEVHRIAFDSDTGRPTRLVVRTGLLFSHDLELPADAIASVDDGVVYLSLDKAQLPVRSPHSEN